MKKIWAICRYTIKENIRHKIFYVILLFAAITVGINLLFGFMAGDEQIRLLFDFGLGAIEIFGLVVAIFVSSGLIIEETESKTVYLILSRPVKRIEYIFGRYLGMILTVIAGLLIMAAVHVSVLFSVSWPGSFHYLLALAGIGMKIILVSAIALFFSLFSTSVVTAVVFTIFFWILGHFGTELRYLSSKISNIFVKAVLKLFFYIMPNFQYANFRDFASAADASLILPVAYTFFYSLVCICLSSVLFSKKEF